MMILGDVAEWLVIVEARMVIAPVVLVTMRFVVEISYRKRWEKTQ